MAELSEGKKIRRAGVKLIPKFKIEPPAEPAISDADEEMSADPAPRKSTLVIKKVSAAPSKFIPKSGAKVTAKIIADEALEESVAAPIAPRLRTKKEVDAAVKTRSMPN